MYLFFILFDCWILYIFRTKHIEILQNKSNKLLSMMVFMNLHINLQETVFSSYILEFQVVLFLL